MHRGLAEHGVVCRVVNLRFCRPVSSLLLHSSSDLPVVVMVSIDLDNARQDEKTYGGEACCLQ